MSAAVIATYLAASAYIGLIVFLIGCLFFKRCSGVDEHAMIPDDERLVNAQKEVDK